jgi:hypothetical protein
LDEFQIFNMHFLKPSSTTPVTVKGREGDADVANKACLRSDLVKEWGDVSTVRGGRGQGKNIRESEAVVGIE